MIAQKSTIKHYKKVCSILGNSQNKIESSFDYIRLAKKGIKANSIENFRKNFDLNKETTANLFAISEPTLYRWLKANKQLDKNFAVKLMEVIDVFVYGITVFESKENFLKWLQLPNTALGGLEPIEVLEYPNGIAKVSDVLGRIEYGVYS